MASERSASAVLHNAQILRFIAAFMVLFGHIQHEATEALFMQGRDHHPWSVVFLPGGVDIFFVLSGFIMLHLGHASFGQPGQAWRFLVRRVVRVAPMYWLFTSLMLLALLMFPGHVAHKAIEWPHALASYVFLPWENAQGRYYPVLILGWTLNFEMFFYAVMSLSLAFPRPVGLALLVGVLAVLGVGGVFTVAWPTWLSPMNFWWNPIVLEFLMGVGIAALRLRGLRLTPLQAGSLVAVALCWMIGSHQWGLTGTHWLARPWWMGLPAALLVLSAVCLPETGALPAWKRWLSRGGDWSFAIYLSHPFSLTAAAMIWHRLGWTSLEGYMAASLVAGILAGKWVHEWIEVPVTSWMRTRLDRLLRPGAELGERHGVAT
jgi:exopolysaccharide production protein ExoZ